MQDPNQSQADAQPEATEQTPAPEASGESQAVDYAALEKEIGELGDGYSLSTVAGKTRDLIKGMNEAQRGHAQYKQRMSTVEPLVEAMNRDPNLRNHLRNATQEYLTGGRRESRDDDIYGGDSRPQVPQYPAVNQLTNAFDPIRQELDEVKIQLYDQQMNRAMDDIARDHPMEDTTRIKIWQEIERTGNPDVEAHYWKIMGPTLVSKARGEAARETAKDITEANQAYVPPGSVGHVPPGTPDVAGMEKNEWDDAVMDELDGMFRGS